jgi:hypothetical protein
MDKDLLKEKAEHLKSLLVKYSSVDNDANALLLGLTSMLDAALNERIDSPVEWRVIPGAYQFNESSLRQHRDLEEAYAEFKIEMTGGESVALKIFRQGMRDKGHSDH